MRPRSPCRMSWSQARTGGEVLGWLPERRAEWDEWNRKRIENNPKGPRSRFVTSEDRENWR